MGKPYNLKNKMLLKYFIPKTKIVITNTPFKNKVLVYIRYLNDCFALTCIDSIKGFEDQLKYEYDHDDSIMKLVEMKYKIMWELLK